MRILIFIALCGHFILCHGLPIVIEKHGNVKRQVQKFHRFNPGVLASNPVVIPQFEPKPRPDFALLSRVNPDIHLPMPGIDHTILQPPIPGISLDIDHPISSLLLPLPVLNQIRETCTRKNCKGQHPVNSHRRGAIKELRSLSLQKARGHGRGKSKHEADALVEEHFNKVFAAKQAYYDFLGILDVADPSDDGLFAGDLLLNDKQLEQFMNTLHGLHDTLSNLGHVLGRRRRSALYFEDPQYEVQLWTPMPIPYFVDTSSGITSEQRNLIRAALSEITNSTHGRISFTQLDATISDPFLQFTAAQSPGICGASSIGKQDGDNSIYLNFNCAMIYGTIIHETMHSLGAAHHHTRLDRDTFLTVNWTNVQSFCYDAFALNDINTYTTYGTQYSYGSIMHYAGNVCPIDVTIPTLVPRQSLAFGMVMGQRTAMSQTDADLLNRMYCCGGNSASQCMCRDGSVHCGYWTNVNYCSDQRYTTYMTQSCAKSCSGCAC